MSKDIPCRDCITLAICRARAKKGTVFLAIDCSLFKEYISMTDREGRSDINLERMKEVDDYLWRPGNE
jgi:hypothetical protein